MVVSAFVMIFFRSESKTNREAVASRNKGVEQWGVKMNIPDAERARMSSEEDHSLAEVQTIKTSGSKILPGGEDEIAESYVIGVKGSKKRNLY